MRIIDEETGEELSEEQAAALRGFMGVSQRAKAGAYETIDNVTKFALSDEDYEAVLLFHRFTDREALEHDIQAAQIAYEAARDDWEELLESIFSADSLTEFLKLIVSTKSRATVANRRKLREALRELKAKLGA